MKKTLLFCLLFIIANCVHAQQSKEAADFNSYSNAMDSTYRVFSKAKDFPKAIQVISEWQSRYEQLSPQLKKNFTGYKAGITYNMACYYALSGQKAKAIECLNIAFVAGFSDYGTISSDSDLASLHSDDTFKSLVLQIREKGDYGYILQKSGAYSNQPNNTLPAFSYQNSAAPELAAFRAKFNLDSVSGNGDEISKFKNLLFWAHNIVRHDGNSNNPLNRNAIDLIAVCKKDNRGVNCRMMATILKDAYQAEGFEARLVTCLPKDTADFDCHVINVVWSKTLNKWIWMDPTFNAYLRDEKGNYLNIEEVRERLINGSPVVLNDDANWNNLNKETKEMYFNYMSKNLYWLQCPVKSEWDLETRKDGKPAIVYVDLFPGGFSTIHQPLRSGKGITEYATNSPDYFWQKPSKN